MNANRRTSRTLGALCLGMVCAFPVAAHAEDSLYVLQREWWQWAISIPLGPNPLTDDSGRDCGVGQRGEYWFVAGNAGGRSTRSCTVPRGVKLVVPVVTSFCYPEEGFDDDASCIAYIVNAMAGYGPADLLLKLDGKDQEIRQVCEVTVAPGDDISGVPGFCRIHRRANRNLFTFRIAQNSILPSTPGLWRANGANGFWGVIDTRNLAPGKHVLKLKATGDFSTTVTYNLTIASPTN
jgi:hypothetical protein